MTYSLYGKVERSMSQQTSMHSNINVENPFCILVWSARLSCRWPCFTTNRKLHLSIQRPSLIDPQLSQKQKRSTDNPTPPQQSRTGSQETHYQQSSHNVLLKSTQPSDPVKPTLEENRKGVVSVHFDQTSSKRVKEARLNNRPKGKTGGQRKQIKGCSVLIESEVSDKPNRKKAESEVGPAGSRVQCTSCMKPPSQCDPKSSAACVCGKSKAETGQKKATKSSQKTKCVKKKDSLDSHKGTQPLVVKINLSLLSRIPPTCSFTERPSVVIQHRSKTDKPHKVTKTSRKTVSACNCVNTPLDI